MANVSLDDEGQALANRLNYPEFLREDEPDYLNDLGNDMFIDLLRLPSGLRDLFFEYLDKPETDTTRLVKFLEDEPALKTINTYLKSKNKKADNDDWKQLNNTLKKAF